MVKIGKIIPLLTDLNFGCEEFVGASDNSGLASSPAHASWHALERTFQVARDPAAVEAAGLRRDGLVADEALVHCRGIDGQMVTDGFETGGRVGVAPGGAFGRLVADADGPVAGLAFPLAKAAACGWFEFAAAEGRGRDVVDRGVGGFEDAEGSVGVGDGAAGEDDADGFFDGFQGWGAGVVPDVFHEAGPSVKVPRRCKDRLITGCLTAHFIGEGFGLGLKHTSL